MGCRGVEDLRRQPELFCVHSGHTEEGRECCGSYNPRPGGRYAISSIWSSWVSARAASAMTNQIRSSLRLLSCFERPPGRLRCDLSDDIYHISLANVLQRERNSWRAQFLADQDMCLYFKKKSAKNSRFPVLRSTFQGQKRYCKNFGFP
jgi:hypothetical protein